MARVAGGCQGEEKGKEEPMRREEAARRIAEAFAERERQERLETRRREEEERREKLEARRREEAALQREESAP
ncbi:uncharacterized protein ARMOST_16469 [Armillaria ostoyae]|uniref:Uncharacterized protein n=1 Tax=Armillaria ostoyae TaxID=47428 RepID=A0A284RWA4_ARMOS|nr:uncharacterized protein ARMOST_16469 [Armillaria ostoyae]